MISPRAMIKEDNLEFLFLDSNHRFINLYHNARQKGETMSNVDLSASFQACVLDILMAKTKRPWKNTLLRPLVVAGGVWQLIRAYESGWLLKLPMWRLSFPPLRLCGDNAGMIALAAVSEYNKENSAGWV